MTFGPYPAKIRDWHDGDTCYLDIDLGFAQFLEGRDWDGHPRLACRIFGINAPELNTDAGRAALAFAEALAPPGTRAQVLSYGWDKYGGRFDGAIALPDGSDFGQAMIAAGQAVKYP